MTSTIKVNKIEKVDGSTIEIGGPGTAVNLACGATQAGFGRAGAVDWCTTAKTTPFTATNGSGLRNAVRVKSNVVGGEHKFPTMGKGIATARVPQTHLV